MIKQQAKHRNDYPSQALYLLIMIIIMIDSDYVNDQL